MSKTLADQAYEILEDKIVRLEYKPGELISENQLSAELGIGRMPIREAIKRLENAHLIKIMPRRGMMVTEIKMEEIFLQIEVRRVLERLIVRRAAKLSTPAERKKFIQLAKEYEHITKLKDHDGAMKVDDEFNHFVAECARNPFATASIKPLHALARRMYYHQYQEDEELILQINQAHCDLMMAISEGDEKKAVENSDHLIDLIVELYRKNYVSMID